MDPTNEDKLFGEFPQTDTAGWESKITEDLKGADYEKKLVWKTDEGFAVKPYYRSEDLSSLFTAGTLPGQFPFTRGNSTAGNDWLICQNVDETEPAEANRTALDAIKGGATAVAFDASAVDSAQDLLTMLAGIDTGKIHCHFHSAPNYVRLFSWLQEKHPRGLQGGISFDADPLSYLLLKGNFFASQESDLKLGERLITMSTGNSEMRLLNVNGRNFRNAGGTLSQELGFALAMGAEYLLLLKDAGIAPDKAARHLSFTFATGSNYFMEIAKLRAARYLWSVITRELGATGEVSSEMFIHSVSYQGNLTLYDPYVNMLRTTTGTMSAAIGGARMITVLPFDSVYKAADAFSTRIARNQQVILKEESGLDKVADPAGGSYYIETLTAQLIEQAWKIFLEVEQAGGATEAIKAGIIQKEIAQSAEKLIAGVASRRTVLLGTNQYPNAAEQMFDKIQTDDESNENGDPARIYPALEIIRMADQLEDVRLATEIYEAEEGERPAVYLLNFGNLAMRKARAGFASNFFGSAGYRIIDGNAYESIDEAVSQALASKAQIVVLCSSDEEYGEDGVKAASALKAAEPGILLVVAGNPTDHTDKLKEAGVDSFIHVRSNLYETLYATQQQMGIML